MCRFFSFVTDPVNHPAEYYFFDWEYRKSHLDDDGVDSHSHICAHFKLDEDRCNKYEFNPLTKKFVIDMINSERDDSDSAVKWVKRLDFKTVVEPLIIEPIVNPFKLPKVDYPTNEQIGWLKEWDSVRASVEASVGASVWASVEASVGASVWNSVWNSVEASVGASVWNSVWNSVEASVWNSVGNSVEASVWNSVRASVWAYISTFINVNYRYDFTPAIKLWEAGLVPSFDGKTWRLHSGINADVVYEWQRC